MREALQQCHDILESTLCHVSHGGPTRAEAEAVLASAKKALAEDNIHMRGLERSLAYESAQGDIQGNTLQVHPNGEGDAEIWYDIASVDDLPGLAAWLTESVEYLEWRSLLKRHSSNPNYVMVADEGEPFPNDASEGDGKAGA